MLNIIVVGLGGFLGAASRYALGLANNKLFPSATFPINTLVVNVIGSFVIGCMMEYFTKNGTMGSSLQLFIMVGILGGFTTFSSFSLETMNLFAGGKMTIAIYNIFLNVILCLVFVVTGKLVVGKL